MAGLVGAVTGRVGRLLPKHSALFVCDIQERFRPIIHQMPAVIDTAHRMVRGAGIFDIPVVYTEQYSKALGPTVSELQEALATSKALQVEKKLFSMVTPEVNDWLQAKPSVKQTTLDLIDKGYEVHLVVDGISSQRALDRSVGLQRVAQSGGLLVTSEMALFQLLGSASHPAFKQISGLAKEKRPEPVHQMSLL